MGTQEGADMTEYKLTKDINRDIFRAYDIRGIADKDLTEDTVYSIGMALGSEAQDKGQNKVVIARDGRISGPKLLAALSAGLRDSGCDVINLGAVTTPMCYYAASVLDTRSGIMLSGSHNPPEYNGIKIVIDGITYSDEQIKDFYRRIQENDLRSGNGQEQAYDIVDQYIDRVVSDIKLERPLKIVIDCGNGIGGKIAPTLFKKLGCEVIELFSEVDGNFPNHIADPSIAENLNDLIAAVKQHHADVGLAFDGDADRLGVITNKGEIVWPDRIMILFVRDILPRHPGANVTYDIKCTRNLALEITKLGGVPVIGRSGHALMKARIKKLKTPVAGELSGHFFFSERWYGFDDGIYSGARLLEILAKDKRTSSEVFATVPDSISTNELKLEIADNIKYDFMEKFIKAAKFPNTELNTIDGIRVEFVDGFGLMRPSNTTPAITFRFEGDSEEALQRIIAQFKEQLLALDPGLELPF